MISQETRLLRAKIIGAKIKKLRLQNHMTLKDAGELLGVSSSVLSSYESGKKAVSLPELELIAFHFNSPVQLLYADTGLTEEESSRINPERLLSLRQRVIGAKLRTQRMEADLSLREVARAADIPPSRLSAYERGERTIPLPELEAIMKALGQSIEEYLETHGPVGEWILLRSQLDAFEALPEELREFLVNPENLPYLRFAHRLSGLPLEELQSLGEGMVKLVK